MAIKRRDFQKLSSTVQEFLLKLPDEEASARLRDNLLHALHFLQLYYRVLQNRDKNNDPLQWNIDHSLSPLTPFKEAPDKFEWEWINAKSQKLRQSLPKTSIENFKALPQILSAIKDGDLETVQQLIKQDESCVNDVDLLSRDCITYAVQFDQIEILKLLLKNGANINNIASDASTSLHRAVYKNNPAMVQILLDNKANVNAIDSYSRSPLHWTVVNQEVDCLKILLKYNPNTNVKDKDGMTPCMWACHLDHLEHLKLISKLDDENKTFPSSNLNELESDNDGRTWLHWSIRKNEPFECLKFLLNNGSALLRDKEGKTCLHVASEQGAVQACKIIIELTGSKIINEKDNKKQTPLHLATLNGHARTIKILMDNGADATIRDATGASSIDYVTNRNLFFCNSIIEICLRNLERKTRQTGASSSNSLASSLNGNELNLTPAPPTTPKNTFTRSFPQQIALKDLSGRPPRPININNSLSFHGNENYSNQQNGELSKTAPANLSITSSVNNSSSYQQEGLRILVPPSPPAGVRTRPSLKGGWTSNERIMSGSLRLSRASTTTSLASDDLDKYMNNSTQNLENYTNNNEQTLNQNYVNGYNEKILANNKNNVNNVPNIVKPLPPPRIASTSSAINNRMFSGRSQDTPMSTASYEPQSQFSIPPPVKPRKSSSVASLNNSNLENQAQFNKQNNHFSSENNLNTTGQNNLNSKGHQLNYNRNNSLNVEDISGDELSTTSIKGEGYPSDLSDNEVKNPSHQHLSQRAKIKKAVINIDSNPKRPTTPMDVRMHEQQKNVRQPQHQQQQQQNDSGFRNTAIRHQQIGDHQLQNTGTGRFNEWDPFNTNRQQNDRQKSPLKSKQQQQQQQQSNFVHTFLNIDSSPRQSSGRSQIGSANTGGQKLQMSPQQQQQQQQPYNSNSNEMNSSSNLDLIVSGQKFGGRKDLSPTNTPRDNQSQQAIQHQNMSQQQQQQSMRVFTRRLQPLDKNSIDSFPPNNFSISNVSNVSNDPQFLRQKKTNLDRKKLEPIKNLNNTINSHVESVSTGQSMTENEITTLGGQTNNNNDEELSISENTLSSEKQMIGNVRNTRKKKSSFSQNRKKFIEPLSSDGALKM